MKNSGPMCRRCSSQLEEEKVLDYAYYCRTCDENFYQIEVSENKGDDNE